jgi:3-oxoacyl-[acyl-carrier protein] reductase
MSTPPTSRIAIVTGAARGIGASISRRLAEEGLDIAVLDLDAKACQDTVKTVKALGRRAIAISADVSDESAVAMAVETVAAELGAPSVLVNNAGILRDRMAHKLSLADWDVVLNVNLKGAFLMSREVYPHMRASEWGRIINISSIAALGHLGQTNYSAAKAGLLGMTKTMALEFGKYNITVNAVAPGFTATEMTRATAEKLGQSFEEMEREIVKDVAVGRIGQPEDIANAVAFFADERSGFVSGQTLYVAGGPMD